MRRRLGYVMLSAALLALLLPAAFAHAITRA